MIALFGALMATSLLLAVAEGTALGATAFLALLAVVWPAAALLAEAVVRREYRTKLARYEDDLSSGALLAAVAGRFHEQIEKYRDRMLGPHSEWARARDPLVKAKDEASRAVAYWTQRTAETGAAEFAQDQLALARRLEDKFGRAAMEIDARAEALRAFFNTCEVKLGTLDSRRRDHVESERLARLSSKADIDIVRARDRLQRIGHEFLREALSVASALGGLHKLQLLETAARVEIDQLEVVADRIVEASASDRDAIDELERLLAGGSAG